MTTRSTRRFGWWAMNPVLLAVLAAGCGTDTSPTAPVVDGAGSNLEPVLRMALQDEYHAAATYAGVLEDFGPVLPFTNIIEAERRHAAAIEHLYDTRAWAVPANEWNPDDVTRFGSVNEACAVGVAAEIANVAVYDELLATPGLPLDVVRVFTTNRRASLENHLPAFQICAGW